jgi:hypothetical protein
MARLSEYAEPVAHALLVTAAVTIVWMYWPSEDEARSRSTRSIHLDSSEVLSSWRPADRRIFLFVSPTCSYCNRSMEFYTHLHRTVDSLQRDGVPIALAAVIDGDDSPHAQHQIFRDAGVEVDTLFRLSSRSLRRVGVTGVPTVHLAPVGELEPVTREGLLDATGEHEILSAVRTLNPRGTHRE